MKLTHSNLATYVRISHRNRRNSADYRISARTSTSSRRVQENRGYNKGGRSKTWFGCLHNSFYFDMDVSAGAMKKKLQDYESQPSAEEERRKHKANVEKTVKDRSKALGELVVRVMLSPCMRDIRFKGLGNCRLWCKTPSKIIWRLQLFHSSKSSLLQMLKPLTLCATSEQPRQNALNKPSRKVSQSS